MSLVHQSKYWGCYLISSRIHSVVTYFECFVFMALSVQIKNSYIEKCPLPRHQNSLALIPALASIDKFPPIDFSSSVRGRSNCSNLTSFVTSCNMSRILSRNSLCHKFTNPPYSHDSAWRTV